MRHCDNWRKGLAALVSVSVLALASTSAQAFDWGSVKGSGRFTTVQRTVSDFTGLSLELPAKLELVQGEVEGLSMETDDNLAPLIETVVEDRQLKIRLARSGKSIDPRRLNITVRVRALNAISISGSGDVHSARLAAPRLRLSVAGSGDVRLDELQSESLKVSVAGSGDVTASGRADAVDAHVAGSGELRLGRLAAKEVKLSIAGSGNATVWATQTLAVNVAGSGDARYYGDAKLSSSVAGSGSLKRLGGAPQ